MESLLLTIVNVSFLAAHGLILGERQSCPIIDCTGQPVCQSGIDCSPNSCCIDTVHSTACCYIQSIPYCPNLEAHPTCVGNISISCPCTSSTECYSNEICCNGKYGTGCYLQDSSSTTTSLPAGAPCPSTLTNPTCFAGTAECSSHIQCNSGQICCILKDYVYPCCVDDN